jgi:O-antigen/teichoic acid export membrane protein
MPQTKSYGAAHLLALGALNAQVAIAPHALPSQHMLFVKQVASLFSGIAVAQLLQLVALPFLTRLYGPDNYGAYGIFAASLLFLGMAATLRYELAIQLPRNDSAAGALARACTWISVAVAVVSFLVATLAARRLNAAALAPHFPAYLACSAFLLGLSNTLSALAARQHNYRAISAGRVVQVVVSVGVGLGCAYGGFLQQGLLAANVIGHLCGCVTIGHLSGAAQILLARSSLRRTRAVLHHYRSFALFNLPQAALDGLRPLGIISALQLFFGATATGLYHVATQALQTPTLALSQSIAQVYYRDLVDSVGTRKGRRMASRLLFVLASAATLGLAALLVCGRRPVDFLLGSRWSGVHGVMTSIALAVAVNFVVSPLVFVFHVLGRHKEFLAWGAAYNAFAIASIATAGALGARMNVALTAYSVSAAVILAALGARSVSLASRPWHPALSEPQTHR